ncbi:MAG TPA: hypothetical protein PLR32_03850 [candidate division Zixibacteria bacterium]|nr:hypothetical protein [candidate division Zixibacteria bacterium]MDD4917730.1 hypothetical protein [candidate division Zixibacteria bacterium]MDM7972807.1 hypothetical protein [candidate division Zixibacteria bacterium]HOD66293.1 hypothetical protein [candidate division Zixibacteria bacterium]HOZ08152.1 hypothetical protein [candidate division Zixibacteria bacterium]
MKSLRIFSAWVILLLGSALACSVAENRTAAPHSELPPVIDTLRGLFDELQQAVLQGQPERFSALLDPAQADTLEKLIRKHGYLSLRSYIERQFARWPNLDTLQLYEIKESGDYIRLTYAGPGTSFGAHRERVRYTFLLYKRIKGTWRLAAVTDFESDRYDPYGYGCELSYHETDLPPRLRFPRLF